MTHEYRVGDRVTVREPTEVFGLRHPVELLPIHYYHVTAVRPGAVQVRMVWPCPPVWLPLRFVVPLTSPSAGAGATCLQQQGAS